MPLLAVTPAGPDRRRDATLPAYEDSGEQRDQREEQCEDSEQVRHIGSALVRVVCLVVVVRRDDLGRGGSGIRKVDELRGVVQNQTGNQVEVRAAEAGGRIPAGRCREGIFTAVGCFNGATNTASLGEAKTHDFKCQP